uniref:Uncharacterized protein n=1 Tax=Arundo donax TaxID=35708 RepID=A0A0A9GH11_ARUDO
MFLWLLFTVQSAMINKSINGEIHIFSYLIHRIILALFSFVVRLCILHCFIMDVFLLLNFLS